MLLNTIEFLSMNTPVRKLIQDKIEAKELRLLSDIEKCGTVLEIGCGSGYGTQLIRKYFMPKKIFAIDLDKHMISVAKKNNSSPDVVFSQDNATKLSFKNSMFDAVFDFGIIHHIPNWKDCLHELKRVLKPGGQVILEDLSIESFQTPFGKFLKKILYHPYRDMYEQPEFIEYLQKLDFNIVKTKTYYPLHILKYFVVVAKKMK